MANKLFAVFVICVVVFAALQVQEATAADDLSEVKFKTCFNTCKDDCIKSGKGFTQCETSCDDDCSNKEFAGISM